MTRDNIEDYLYFFWAPLLKTAAVAAEDMDVFQKMIILTLSQASVYIEAPTYKVGSSRDFSDDIKIEVSDFTDKIVSNIPGRSPDDSYWLKIAISNLLPAEIGFADTHLEAEQSFGSYKVTGEQFISFDFYSLAHQLQIQLPLTPEMSVVLSTKIPVVAPDGPITNLDLASCTIWLSAPHFDVATADATLYTSVRLKQASISFDNGYIKSGNRISAGLLSPSAAFVITCISEDEIPADEAGITIAAKNQVVYPEKFVFTVKNPIGLPLNPKIILTHTEGFSSAIFGANVNSIPVTDVNGIWIADKRLLSFALQTETDAFAATENASAVFDLKGSGKIINPAWLFATVSTSHPLAFGRLGVGSESGYLGFDIKDEFTISWQGLENGPVKIKAFSLRNSPNNLLITYTSTPNLLAKQQLKLWMGNEKQRGRSSIQMTYSRGGAGNFISHRKSSDQHIGCGHSRQYRSATIIKRRQDFFENIRRGIVYP